jgi:hypothetical protein
MQETIALRHQYRDSIREEINQRIKDHQATIAALRSAQRTMTAAPAANPLIMLAHGDSWFDYPLDGNTPIVGHTDIIAHLGSMGSIHPIILNLSHWGDASTNEMSWPKQDRMIQVLQDANNWPNAKPDAILFSAGGNDIAGDQFCIFLDYAGSGPGLNTTRFTEALGMVEASYRDLFAFRDKFAPGVPIIGHCYDFPVASGIGAVCLGPWLWPSLKFAGWSKDQGTAILHEAMLAFRTMVANLASDPANNFLLVDTQGTLAASDWANELHPFPDGFKKIAEKFVPALQTKFTNI